MYENTECERKSSLKILSETPATEVRGFVSSGNPPDQPPHQSRTANSWFMSPLASFPARANCGSQRGRKGSKVRHIQFSPSKKNHFDDQSFLLPDSFGIRLRPAFPTSAFLSLRDLYHYDLKTGETRRLTRGERASQPHVSPTDSELCMCATWSEERTCFPSLAERGPSDCCTPLSLQIANLIAQFF